MINRMFVIGVSTILFWGMVSSVQALTVNFDDLDASVSNVDLSSATYQGFTWSNVSAYTHAVGLEGFNNGSFL